MMVDLLRDGSPRCPILRVHDVSDEEAACLRSAAASLAAGEVARVSLRELIGKRLREELVLSLVVGAWDLGLVEEEAGWAWVLRRGGWDNVEGLIEPFAAGAHGYQWLSVVGGAGLLMSRDGRW
jgi:hypothetical protein